MVPDTVIVETQLKQPQAEVGDSQEGYTNGCHTLIEFELEKLHTISGSAQEGSTAGHHMFHGTLDGSATGHHPFKKPELSLTDNTAELRKRWKCLHKTV